MKTAARPKYTPAGARMFIGFSLSSANQTFSGIEGRAKTGVHENCQCKPYDDTFTFDRWLAQGYCVNKGEKAIKIATWVPIAGSKELPEGTDVQGNDEKTTKARLKPHIINLFCRCQVSAKGSK